MQKVRLGVMGTARIATEAVIPAMQKCRRLEVTAVASRDRAKAEKTAAQMGIPKSFGSYDQLLEDPEIDAVYIPLPNHMHVPWSVRSLQAGKHVLCEKPMGLSAAEVNQLLQAAEVHPHLKVSEAFMYRHHPRWKKTIELVSSGALGEVTAVLSIFSYHNDDPRNIRNQAGTGGGGLMDIGCYSVSLSRWIFGREPDAVTGVMQMDPRFQVDRLTSGILDFTTGTSVFTCSTRASRDQHVKIIGDLGKVEMEMPFRPPVTEPTELLVTREGETEKILFDPCDQFTIQGENFALSILENRPVAVPLEDALENMRVIDRLKESG